MSSGSDFVLKLIDQLSGPARAMTKALGSVLSAEKAVASAGTAVQASAAKAGAAVAAAGAMAAKGAAGFAAAASAMKAAGNASAFRNITMSAAGAFKGGRLGGGTPAAFHGPRFDPSAQGAAAGGMGPVLDRSQQNLSWFQKIDVATKRSRDSIADWNTATGESVANWKDMSAAFMKTPFGMVAGGLGKIAGMLADVVGATIDALVTAGKLTIVLGAVAAISFTKQVVEMAAFADRSKRALGFLMQSAWDGKTAFRAGVQLAKDLGTNVEETVEQLIKLRSMQFTIGEASEIIKLGADLKAITGDAESAKRAITAMTQIKAKGKLQSEELVGQLAEAGVSTVLVYQELEKKLGKDRNGVLKLLQGGKIDADTGLDAIKKAIMHKVGTDKAGTVGATFAKETMSGLLTSMRTSVDLLFLDLGEMIDTSPLIEGMKQVMGALDGASRGGMVGFVNAMLRGVGKLIPLVIDFAQGFGSGLGAIAEAISGGSAGDLKQWARDAGLGVATFFARVIDVSKKIADVLPAALGALFEGLDVNKLLADMNGFDWKAFGEKLVTIAKALGSIINATAKIAGFGVGVGADVAGFNSTKAAKPQGDTETSWFGWLDDRRKQLEAEAAGGSVSPTVEPTVGAGASSRANMQNKITIPITINGAVDESTSASLGKDVGREVETALWRFADGSLSQATG